MIPLPNHRVPDGASVADARDWLELQMFNEGANCPCCGQFAKVYQRTINSAMARALILFHKEGGTTEWVHGPSITRAARADEAKLRYWELIEESAGRREDGARAGLWRVTPAGEQFVRGLRQVPRYALIYDGRLLGFDGDLIGIKEALGTRFDYAELMAAVPRQRRPS